MSAPTRTMSDSSQHSDSLRKRVGRACDRCRLKKSKCNGDSPCSRCIADNAICVFGERKRAHDKIYPKGYVEMLEQQQGQLVAGLQETYRRLRAANLWPGAPLDEREGHPLTHDILTTLDIIHNQPEGLMDMFEEDTEKLQRRLIAHGAPLMHRRGSVSSDSDHSTTHSHDHAHAHSQSHPHKRPRSQVDSPMHSPKVNAYRKSFDHEAHPDRRVRATSTSSPRASVLSQSRNTHRPSPLHVDSAEMDQLPAVEEDALMSSFSWQDLPSESISTPDPQFTFPISQQPTGYGGAFDQWSDLVAPNMPNMLYQQMPSTMAYTNMQQLQRDSVDTDLSGFVPVGVS